MKDLQEFMQNNNLTGASIARTLGVSTATVSLVKNGKLDSIKPETIKLFEDYIANYHLKTQAPKKEEIKETFDLKMVAFTCNEIIIGQEMGAIFGKAGSGKSKAIQHYIAHHPEAIYIETIPSIRVRDLLKQILKKQGYNDAVGTTEELFYQSVGMFKRSEKILIIDEAENLTTKNLEIIRRIHDFSQLPTVLVGTYALIQNLKGRGGELFQLSSRITNHWKMQGLTEDDEALLFGKFAKQIKGYTKDLRCQASIYRKGKRLAQLSSEKLNANHIKMASQTAILN